MATQSNNFILIEKDAASPIRGQQRSIDAADDIVLSPTSVTLSPTGTAAINSGGAASINSTDSTIGIGNVSATGAISIGTAGNRGITLGNATNTVSLNLNGGSGGINIANTSAANVSISSGVSAGTVTISTGAGANTTSIATGAGVKTLTLGSTNTTSISTLQSGTGGIVISSATTGTIQLGNDTGTGTISIGSSTGARQIDIGNGATSTATVNIVGASATGARTINIGTGGTGAKTVIIGENTNASSGSYITGGSTFGVNIATGAAAIPVNVATGSTAGTVSIGTGAASSQTLNFGTGAAAKLVTVGSQAAGSSTVIYAGSGNLLISASAGTLTMGATGSSAIAIGNDTATGTISIASSTGAHQVDIGAGAVAQTLNFGTGAGAKTLAIGNSSFAASVTDLTGGSTSGVRINQNVSSPVSLNAGTSTGTITLGGSASQTINIGSGTGSKIVTLGSNSASSTTTIDGYLSIDIARGTGFPNVNIAGSTSGSQTINIGYQSGLLSQQTVNIGSVGAAGSTVTIAAGTTGGINIGTAAVATPVNIATGSTAGTVSIATGTAAQAVNVGTGGTGAKTISIGNTTVAGSAVAIDAGSTGGVWISSGGVGGNVGGSNPGAPVHIGKYFAQTTTIGSFRGGTGGLVDIANWTSADNGATATVNIGESTQTGSAGNPVSTTINIGAASGGSNHAKVVTIGNTAASASATSIQGGATGGVSLATANGAPLSMGTGAFTQTLNIGTGAGAKTLAIGSTNTTSATTVQSGTGAMTFTAGGAYAVNATGAVTVESSGGTITIGANAVSQNVNIGTGGDRIIAIGRSDTTQYVELRPGRRAVVLGSGSVGGTHGLGYFATNRTGLAQTDGVLVAWQESPAADQVNAQFVLASAAAGSAASIRYIAGILANNTSVANGAAGIVCTMHGAMTPVTFTVPPAGPADIGKPVYLSSTPGKATLTAPSGSGETVYRVGYLSRGVADVNGNWFVLLAPQFIADIP